MTTEQVGRAASISKRHRDNIARLNRDFLENHTDHIQGLDPKYLDDELNYRPNTDYSVTLNFKKEFVRHKRVICSIKEFKNYDIQNKWDLGYC